MVDTPSLSTEQQKPHSKHTGVRGILVAILKVFIVGVLLYFLYRQVAVHWDEIRATDWTIDFFWLIPSILTGLVTFAIMASVWRGIIGAFGHRLRLREAFRIIYLSDLGRYIPGKVWQLFGVLYLARQKGIPPEQAGASFVLVQMFAIPASFLVFVLAAQFESRLLTDQISFLGKQSSYILTGTMVAACLALVLVPQRFITLGNRLLRRFKRPAIDFRLDKTVALTIFVGYCIGWICYGVAFWLFVRAVVPDSRLSLVAGVGLFNAAYQIGYLTLIAPGGLGPRELVMGTLLIPFVGPIGPAVAIAARLWAIIIESSAALLALAVGKR
ncbi:MAG: flippase-like domain-containing protein [candidate division Zixibacteria bacterium]|nr:flippase-like domain-containing protein [candidate division Zixibacteria bacterium]